MSMIEIALTPRECELIRLGLESMRESCSHRGDGLVITTDEAMIEEKLARAGKLRFTRHHLELVLGWVGSSTIDDLRLRDKIQAALEIAPPRKQKP